MARNMQPIAKRCKALGLSPAAMGYAKKETNRNQAGNMRKKKSEYALQLTEKQKVKFIYGILEKQFHMYYEKATRMQGKGLGSAMMHAVIDKARAEGKKAIRLDLIDLNLPTGRMYTRLGFEKRAEVRLFYPEVKWQLFHMFEYVL